MNLSDKQKKLVTWIGFPLLGLFTFVMTLQLTFPYERVRDRIIDELDDKYDVTIGDVEPMWSPGGVRFKTFILKTRPEEPGETPTTIIIDELEIDVGLLAAITGTIDVDVLARIGKGNIEGNVALSKSKLSLAFDTDGLPLGDMPGLKSAVGLPMDGGLDARFELDLPMVQRGAGRAYAWNEADGRIELSCPGCTIGDGESKIKPPTRPGRAGGMRARQMAFMADGLTVPPLDLGNLAAEIVIDKGKGEVKRFGGSSKDGELLIEAELQLAPRLKDSTLPGCVKFKLSDALKQREPKFGNLPVFMGVPQSSDGYAQMKIKGKLDRLKWVPTKSCAGRDPGERSGQPVRPRITAKPVEDMPDEPPVPPGPPELGDDEDTGERPTIGTPSEMPDGPELEDRPRPSRDDVGPVIDDEAGEGGGDGRGNGGASDRGYEDPPPDEDPDLPPEDELDDPMAPGGPEGPPLDDEPLDPDRPDTAMPPDEEF